MKKNSGLTKVEVIFIIAFIALWACMILWPILPSLQRKRPCHATMWLIGDFDKALEKYNMDQGMYPPDNENNGGSQEGTLFQYRNDVLVKYLDGDISNGGPRSQYFEFKQRYFDEKNPLIVVSPCEDAIWYHNFNDDSPRLDKKVIDKSAPFHPWTNAIFYKRFQLYTKPKKNKDPYNGEKKIEENFRWIINYK